MNEHELDCCVVRDLLPSYLEELTEPKTTAMVQSHLADCPSCSAIEQDMRCHLSVDHAPKRALRFLRRVKRTRLLAAILCALAALWCIGRCTIRNFIAPTPRQVGLRRSGNTFHSLKILIWRMALQAAHRYA